MRKIYYKNLIIFLILIAILLMAIILINYYGDGGCYFFRSRYVENKLANALLSQDKVLVCTNYNDRNVKKILINRMVKPVEILVLGSSRTISFRKELFNNKSFFNGSVDSADLEDDIVIYYLYQKRGWKPKKIFIGLDPWIVSGSEGTLWKTAFLSEYNHARELFFASPKNNFRYYQIVSGFLEKNTQLLSLYYLNDSIKKIILLYFYKSFDTNRIIINPNADQMSSFSFCHLHLPDGTRLTAEIDESSSPDHADYVGVMKMHQLPASSLELNKNKMKFFEKFIDYLLKQHVEVVFYLPPYESSAYSEIERNKKYNTFNVVEKYFHSISTKYHIQIVGSYNPFILNLNSSDFIDDVHLKQKGINKLFGQMHQFLAITEVGAHSSYKS